MNNYNIYPNVYLGENVVIEDYCMIGKPPKGMKEGELKTVIGSNSIIRSNTVIYAGNIIGDNFQTGHHVTIRELNEIGNNVSVGTAADIEHHIKIEDNVRLHSQVFIPEYCKLEEGCWIGPNVVITNAKYPQSKNVKENLKGVIIKKNAKIGANSTLLPGISIGEDTLIGAGSTVVRNISKGKVAAGNPAKVIKDISQLDVY